MTGSMSATALPLSNRRSALLQTVSPVDMHSRIWKVFRLDYGVEPLDDLIESLRSILAKQCLQAVGPILERVGLRYTSPLLSTCISVDT